MSSLEIEAIDLFCGLGGLTCGLLESGIQVRLGVDCDGECEFPYYINNGVAFLHQDISKVDGKYLTSRFSRDAIKVLAGSPPCKSFSFKKDKESADGLASSELNHFLRLIKECFPEIVLLEGVPGLIHQVVFKLVVNQLAKLGYHVRYSIINYADFGVPQERKRLVLLASRLGEIAIPSPHPDYRKTAATVWDAISQLPPIPAGGGSFFDPIHQCAKLSDKDIALISENKHTGKPSNKYFLRMNWDRPAPMIIQNFTNFSKGRFWHPEQDRALSLREGALLQALPETYEFVPSFKQIDLKKVAGWIGGTVPPPIGMALGLSIHKHLNIYAKSVS